MEFLQEFFLTAFMAVVFSLIVAVSIAFSGGKEQVRSVDVVKLEEKTLKVVGGKTKKKVKFLDDVVVRNVDDFIVEKEPSNDLRFMEKFDAILAKSLEEEISRDEVNIVKTFEKFDYKGTDEKLDLIVSDKKIVDEIGNIKYPYVEQESCNIDFPLIDEVLQKRIDDRETEHTEVLESNHFEEENSQVDSGSEILSAVDLTKIEEIDSITESSTVDDDVSTDQKGVEDGGKDCISTVLLDDTLKREAIDDDDDDDDDNVVDDNDNDDDDDEEDDWEGIERSELEKVFAKAVNYVEYGLKGKNDHQINMESNVQTQLYGLHKLALEGPCYEPQPMVLKVSARAKWNSWQKLGRMTPEAAMEQYIKLLSEIDPKWAYDPDLGDGKGGLIPSDGAMGSDTGVTMVKELEANNEEGRRFMDKDQEV